MDTVSAGLKAGFVIHPTKSILIHPTQFLTFLGFTINSVDMRVALTEAKVKNLKQSCHECMAKSSITVRELLTVIGQMVASFPAVEHARLYYRILDNENSAALKHAKGNFDAIDLSEKSRQHIRWWISNLSSTSCPISHGNPNVTIQTDASNSGWGGVRNKTTTGGQWTTGEQRYHFNCLELLGVLHALKARCSADNSVHRQVQSDNTTTVCYIDNISRDIWEWYIKQNIWLSACHLPGVENTVVDRESRLNHDNTEWQLNPKLLRKLGQIWPKPEIDLSVYLE